MGKPETVYTETIYTIITDLTHVAVDDPNGYANRPSLGNVYLPVYNDKQAIEWFNKWKEQYLDDLNGCSKKIRKGKKVVYSREIIFGKQPVLRKTIITTTDIA